MSSYATFMTAGGAFANDTPTPFTTVVSGLSGTVTGLTVKIDGLTHPDFLFLHFLLVAPDGQSNLLLLDRSGTGVAITNENYLFTDFPDLLFPADFTPLRPVAPAGFMTGSDFGLPSLQLHYGSSESLAAAFSGVNPNGTWTLYVLDDNNGNPGGSFTDWQLKIIDNTPATLTTPVTHVAIDNTATITFSDANGNLPHSSDPDQDPLHPGTSIGITAEHGTIQALSFSATKQLFTGSNSADVFGEIMNGAVYKPDAGFSGVDHLTLQFFDPGEFGGLGFGNLTITKTIDIEVFDHPAATSGNDSFHAVGYQRIDGGAGNDTVTFDFALTQAIVTYGDSTVTIEGPNTKTVLSGIDKFVFNDGTVDNADGNPLVDDLYYYTHNHDVWAAHVDPDAHYSAFGWHEGRNPNAYFDTSGYLATYADVKAAGVNPLEHYDTFGWKEGRDPSKQFDTGDYLGAYPDIAAAKVDPLAHFLLFGMQEGRHASNDGAWG